MRIQVFLFQDCRRASALDGRVRSQGLSFPPSAGTRESSGSVGGAASWWPPPLSSPLPGSPPRGPFKRPARLRQPPRPPPPGPPLPAAPSAGQAGVRPERAGRNAAPGKAVAAGTRAAREPEEWSCGGHGLAAPGRAEGSSHPARCQGAPHTIAARAARAPHPPSPRARPAPRRPGIRGAASPAAREGAGIVRPLRPLPTRGTMGAARRPGPGLARPLRRR